MEAEEEENSEEVLRQKCPCYRPLLSLVEDDENQGKERRSARSLKNIIERAKNARREKPREESIKINNHLKVNHKYTIPVFIGRFIKK
jgi:hypothetical protein